MINVLAQEVLRQKVRGKLAIQCPAASRADIVAAADKAVLDVRDNDDWLFDMMVDVAIASGKEHLREAIDNGGA